MGSAHLPHRDPAHDGGRQRTRHRGRTRNFVPSNERLGTSGVRWIRPPLHLFGDQPPGKNGRRHSQARTPVGSLPLPGVCIPGDACRGSASEPNLAAENSVMRFEHPSLLLLVGVLPALIALYAWADRKRRQAQARFQSSAPTQVHFSRRRWKRACLLAAAISLIVALSKPAWERPGGAPPEDTGDVVFLLDVSRSMLSDDIAPTRLARAKLIIAGLVRQFHGERTALVEFAGVPSVECPLTIDEAFFKTMLERASPTSVARGGTHIGDAIQFSLDSVF